MSNQLNWKCEWCSLTARIPANAKSVRCACGARWRRNGQGWHTIELQRPVDLPGEQQIHRVPEFERWQRFVACQTCQHFKTVRCELIDLGCRAAFTDAITGTRGCCPQDKWPEVRVRWITTADLAAGAMELADQVPPDIVRVVGIPRSGMIPAAAIASKLHLPLYTVRNWKVTPVGGGFRINWGRQFADGGRWLFVDDTIHNGGTFRTLRARGVPLDGHLTAVVYTLNPSLCSLYYKVLPTPHLLEWNLLNTSYVQHLAVDFDGILCHNPPFQELPKYLARQSPINVIISARPERERARSEAWLHQHRVLYRSLRLWPGPDKDRDDIQRVAAWKAAETSAAGAEFYIESEPVLADAIRRLGLRVLCPAQRYLA